LTVAFLSRGDKVGFEMLERTKSNPHPKYSWQQPLLDTLIERNRERLSNRIIEAERVISERLVQEPAEADEKLALAGAVIVLEALRHPNL